MKGNRLGSQPSGGPFCRRILGCSTPLSASSHIEPGLAACHCCGLIQGVPPLQSGERAVCSRCATEFSEPRDAARRNRWAAACALSALMAYPLGIALPVMKVSQLGHAQASSIWSGSLALLAHGDWLVGGAVFVCSVVLPLAKLMGILAVAWFPTRIGDGPARARLLRIIEWVGRWGTLDVLLVALLVATLKLGDLVKVSPGPGLSAFAFTVALSLIASGLFDPHAHWNEYELDDDHER